MENASRLSGLVLLNRPTRFESGSGDTDSMNDGVTFPIVAASYQIHITGRRMISGKMTTTPAKNLIMLISAKF